jgi:hypothetical protein
MYVCEVNFSKSQQPWNDNFVKQEIKNKHENEIFFTHRPAHPIHIRR